MATSEVAAIRADLAKATHLVQAVEEPRVVDLPMVRLKYGSVYNLHHL